MSAARTLSAARTAGRRWAPWTLVVLVGVLAGLVGDRRTQGPPFSPDATGPLGTRAVVEVALELGAEVRVLRGLESRHGPAADAEVAMLVHDRHDDETRARIRRWVSRGGTLILTDPTSPLAPARPRRPATGPVGRLSVRPGCAAPVVRGVDAVAASSWMALEPSANATLTCFPLDGGYGLVAAPAGQGEIVVVGAESAVTNRELGTAANAVLLMNLLVPRPGTRLDVIGLAPPGTGQRTLRDLVPDRVWLALTQLGAAFALVAWWRARRLGDPVEEPLATAVAGSELTLAVGNLLQHGGRRAAAASLLRDDLRRDLASRLGLPAGASSDAVAAVAAARTVLPAERIRAALEDRPVTSDGDLLTLAREVEALRAQLQGRVATGTAARPGGTA